MSTGVSPSGKAQDFDSCISPVRIWLPQLDLRIAIHYYGALAQSVEHLTFNQVVGGSNPPCFIFLCSKINFQQNKIYYDESHFVYADVAELADALDLGSSGRPCRFDSCHPHYFFVSVTRKVLALVGCIEDR